MREKRCFEYAIQIPHASAPGSKKNVARDVLLGTIATLLALPILVVLFPLILGVIALTWIILLGVLLMTFILVVGGLFWWGAGEILRINRTEDQRRAQDGLD